MAGGVHSGWWPSVGFAGMAIRLPSCGLPSQVQVITLLQARGDSECSGDSNTVVRNGRVDFWKQHLSGSDLGQPRGGQGGGDGFPRVLGTSTGAVPGSGTQVAQAAVLGAHEPAQPLERMAAMLLPVSWWKPRLYIFP